MYIQDFKRSFNFYVVQSGSLYGIDSVTLQQKLRLFMVITVRPEQVPSLLERDCLSKNQSGSVRTNLL